ncbi:MAG: hypothetical protein JNK05_20240 [Myxococcales bacterium]|nr:hypothetical protein [Myxococcales bacterium]
MAAAAEHALFARKTGPNPWRIRAAPALLDGNVPLRAAQACAPFIAGNAVGFWLEPPSPIELAIDAKRARCSDPSARVSTTRDEVVVALDTQLEIEPVGGAIALDAARNRADIRVTVDRHMYSNRQTIFCTFRVHKRWLDRPIALDGPLASLTMFAPDARWSLATTDVARAMVERHAAFFDATYFAQKRAGATKRYRSISREPPASLVDASRSDAVVHSLGAPLATDEGALLVRVECAIEAEHFGAVTRCRCDADARRDRAQSIARALSALGATLGPSDRAFEYLAQYVVGHTNGDPHVLVKPALLAATREDWCLVIDCVADGGLRGVTEAAWFHAVPCVAVARGATRYSVGSTLARVRAVPRAMLSPTLSWRESSGATRS